MKLNTSTMCLLCILKLVGDVFYVIALRILWALLPEIKWWWWWWWWWWW